MSKINSAFVLVSFLLAAGPAMADKMVVEGELAQTLMKNLNGPNVKTDANGEIRLVLGAVMDGGREYQYEIRCSTKRNSCEMMNWDTD